MGIFDRLTDPRALRGASAGALIGGMVAGEPQAAIGGSYALGRLGSDIEQGQLSREGMQQQRELAETGYGLEGERLELSKDRLAQEQLQQAMQIIPMIQDPQRRLAYLRELFAKNPQGMAALAKSGVTQLESPASTPSASEYKVQLAQRLSDPNLAPAEQDMLQKQLDIINTKEPSTVVNISDLFGVEKSTKGALEKEYVELETAITGLDNLEKSTKPEFLTYAGQARQYGGKKLEKLIGKPIDEDFQKAYAQWKGPAMREYLRFRKQITGVAARPEEKTEIAQAVPDPETDSYTQFMAKLRANKKMAKQMQTKLQLYRTLGIPAPTAEDLARVSFTEMPEGGEITPELIKKYAPQIVGGALDRVQSGGEITGQPDIRSATPYIRVQSPDGQTGYVPTSDWEEAQRQGYKRIQ